MMLHPMRLVAGGAILMFCAASPLSAQTIEVVSTEVAGGCVVAEVVIDGVLAGVALEARDGALSRLRTGSYNAMARFVKPDTLWLSGGGEVVVTRLTIAGGENDAKTTAERYGAQGGRGVNYDLSLAPAINTEDCTRTVSAIAKASDWERSVLFETLFASKQESTTIPGTYERDVKLDIRRPLDIRLSNGDHVFIRSDDVWKEFSGKSLVAEYIEFERNLAGFDVRDIKPAQVLVFGKKLNVPRIVHLPSGFKYWDASVGARTNVEVYRPVEGILVKAPIRSETKLYQTSIITKSFIKKIITDPIIFAKSMSAANSARLGFEELVGGRVQALELALLTDTLFSELPSSGSRAAEDFRLWSSLEISASCNGSVINSYSYDSPQVAFGKEGPLQAPGRLHEPVKEEVSRSGDRVQAVRIEYSVLGRPHLLALPAFNLIRPRTCSWIWHRITIEMTCVGGAPKVQASLDGSDFPSHMLWVNEIESASIEQQAFDRLWICKSSEPEVVN